MAERHTVKIQDGSTIEVDPSEWQQITSPVRSHWQGDSGGQPDYRTERLTVCRHIDGRTLVYASVQIGDDETHTGEVLPPGSDILTTLRSVAGRSRLTEWHVDECCKNLDRR